MTKNNIDMLNQKLDLLMTFNKEKLNSIEANVKATNGKIAEAQLKIREIETNQINCPAVNSWRTNKITTWLPIIIAGIALLISIK